MNEDYEPKDRTASRLVLRFAANDILSSTNELGVAADFIIFPCHIQTETLEYYQCVTSR
jgi:hypothetical protein